MFYTYRQNNSGGVWHDCAKYVIIEADNSDEADRIAENHKDSPIYFDGCSLGHDCSCCGDRWHRSWENGTEKPTIYGEEIAFDQTEYEGDSVLIIRDRSVANDPTSRERRAVAADLLADAGFDDIAQHLRSI